MLIKGISIGTMCQKYWILKYWCLLSAERECWKCDSEQAAAQKVGNFSC